MCRRARTRVSGLRTYADTWRTTMIIDCSRYEKCIGRATVHRRWRWWWRRRRRLRWCLRCGEKTIHRIRGRAAAVSIDHRTRTQQQQPFAIAATVYSCRRRRRRRRWQRSPRADGAVGQRSASTSSDCKQPEKYPRGPAVTVCSNTSSSSSEMRYTQAWPVGWSALRRTRDRSVTGAASPRPGSRLKFIRSPTPGDMSWGWKTYRSRCWEGLITEILNDLNDLMFFVRNFSLCHSSFMNYVFAIEYTFSVLSIFNHQV